MKRQGLIMAGVMMLFLANGCDKDIKEDVMSLNVENIPTAVQAEDDTQSAEQPDSGGVQADNNPADESSASPGVIQETAELVGDVVSIGDNSVVVSKNFIEKSENGKSDIMWSPAEGSEDEVLINVMVTKDTRYEYITVKNSGSNPEDIETRAGTFQDIRKGLFLDMTGSYQGDDFYAARVTISEFIH